MAYGKVRGVSKPLGSMPARIYPIESNASATRAAILTVPFDFAAGDTLDSEIEQKLYNDFAGEITDGRTYPQEDSLDLTGFRSYFTTYDLIIGFFLTEEQLATLHNVPDANPKLHANGTPLTQSQLSLLKIGSSSIHIIPTTSTASISLPNASDASSYAFAYYIKPNYPGRSSHLCNAGFLVPSSARGLGLGRIAGRSFLYYGPRAGFRGSVFNLVYANNAASVRIWERLGFQNVGRIPEAGRLKRQDGGGEEFVDAWVVHGDFAKIGIRDEN